MSPHTAALSVHENERIVALFSENLRRYLRGDDLIGRVRPGCRTDAGGNLLGVVSAAGSLGSRDGMKTS